MGGNESKLCSVPTDSPLGKILQDWESLGGDPLSKKTLVKFCQKKWPRLDLPGGIQWKKNGSIDQNDIVQLQLWCREKKRWDELIYASCFMSVCEKEKMETNKVMPCMKASRMTVPPPLECPIDDLFDLPPPPYATPAGAGTPPHAPSASQPVNPSPSPSSSSSPPSSPSSPPPLLPLSPVPFPSFPPSFPPSLSPLSAASFAPMGATASPASEARLEETQMLPIGITRRSLRNAPVVQAPLREVVAPAGHVALVHVPFTTSDLLNWKQSVGPLAENPAKVTELLRTIFVTHSPNWGDVMTLLGTFLTGEEKRRLLSLAQDEAVKNIAQGDDNNPEHLIPIREAPDWDPNAATGRSRLAQFRMHILGALPRLYPKPLNLNKLYETRQLKDESPSEFYERLCNTARKWTNLDPSSPENQTMFNVLFIGQSQADIRIKLQKVEGGTGLPISALINIAYKVFHNREATKEAEKEKRKIKTQASIIAAVFDLQMSGKDRGRGRGRGFGSMGRGFGQGEQTSGVAGRGSGFGGPLNQGGRGRTRGGPPPWAGNSQGRGAMRSAPAIPVDHDQCRICRGRGHWARECPQAPQPNGEFFQDSPGVEEVSQDSD